MRCNSAPKHLAVDRDRGQRFIQRQAARVHQRAQHVGREAGALLVGEERNDQRPPRDDAGGIERRDHLESREDAQIAVVAPAGAHGVDMRTGHHRRERLRAGAQAEHVADADRWRLRGRVRASSPRPDRARPCPRRSTRAGNSRRRRWRRFPPIGRDATAGARRRCAVRDAVIGPPCLRCPAHAATLRSAGATICR